MHRKTAILCLPLALIAVSSVAAPPKPAAPTLSSADRVAAFRAGGFHLQGKIWRSCDDPGTASYGPGTIETVADLNGDGLPEAVITESSSYCFGAAGTNFSLVGKQATGAWRLMATDQGVLTPLPTRGVGNWPDLEIGGPGFCFPVLRWNGKAYVMNRYEYERKRCRPQR